LNLNTTALLDARDAQRCERKLSWQGVARELWDQSATLNARRNDHPIGVSTLTGIVTRRDTTCQHALFMLRWLDRTRQAIDEFISWHCSQPRLSLTRTVVLRYRFFLEQRTS
jgi:hypothetical protein